MTGENIGKNRAVPRAPSLYESPAISRPRLKDWLGRILCALHVPWNHFGARLNDFSCIGGVRMEGQSYMLAFMYSPYNGIFIA